MSGANGIEKFLRVDREERMHPKTLSARFYSRFPNPGAAPANELINPLTQAPDPTRLRYPLLTAAVPTTTLDAQQALNDILLTSASAAAITGPSAASIAALLGQLYLTSVGNGLLGANPNNEIDGYTITIENNDVVAKTITFGAGVTPATLTVLPGTVVNLNVEVTVNNPPAVRQYVLSTSTLNPTLLTVPGFGAVRTSNQTAAAATATVLFDNVSAPFNYAGLTYVAGTGQWTVPITGVYNLSTFGAVNIAGAAGQVGIIVTAGPDAGAGNFLAETAAMATNGAAFTQYALVRTGIALQVGDVIQVELVPGAGTMILQGSAVPNYLNGFSASLVTPV